MNALERYEALRGQFTDLWARHDEDEHLIRQYDYDLMSIDNPSLKQPKAESVTLNTAALLYGTVRSALLRAKMQPEVSGTIRDRDLSPKETTIIEKGLQFLYDQGDLDLRANGNFNLRQQLSGDLPGRGSACTVFLIYRDDQGQYRGYMRNWDTRYTVYEYGMVGKLLRPGISQVINQQWRTAAQINGEYGKKMKAADIAEATGQALIPVVTLYDGEWMETAFASGVYGGSTLGTGTTISRERHYLDCVPAVISEVADGDTFQGEDAKQYRGESVLPYIRKLIKHQQRMASLYVTAATHDALGTWTHETTDPEKPQPAPNVPGGNIPVLPGETPKLAERPDISRAGKLGFDAINSHIAQGGAVDIPDRGLPLSGAAINSIIALRERLNTPRLDSQAEHLKGIAELMLYQVKRLTEVVGTLEINERVYKKEDYVAKLQVSYRYMSNDRLLEMANLVAFESARDLPVAYRLTNILKVESPDEVQRQMREEEAERLDPVTKLKKVAHSLMDDVEKLDGWQREAKLNDITAIMATIRKLIQQPPAAPAETGKGDAMAAAVSAGSAAKMMGAM